MNLTDSQKRLIKWLVGKAQAGKLEEEFYMFWPGGGRGGRVAAMPPEEGEEYPHITKNALSALAAERLLICRPRREDSISCTLTGKAFAAVANDFQETGSLITNIQAARGEMYPPTRPIFSNIRTFLNEGFSDRQLRRLCYDEPDFRHVHGQLADTTGKDVIIDLLLEHAERMMQMDKLLALAQKQNPARYETHEPYFEYIVDPTPSGDSRTESQEVSDEKSDVPRFDFSRKLPSTKSIYTEGIQFTDKSPENPSDPPKLYLSVYFKDSKYFVGHPLSTNEKWLYLEANMRPAFNLRIQVAAWNMRDVDELMGFLTYYKGQPLPGFLSEADEEYQQQFLRNWERGWSLQGPRSGDDQAGDYFQVWRENNENRLMISTFTPTNAGISIHARFSDEVAKAFAHYLEEVGFTKPFN